MKKTIKKPLIEIREITKNYGGLKAVDNISLDIFSGEITAIVGGNGAGKSTLIKIISGYLKPNSGEIFFRGNPLPQGNPSAVNRLGIETIYQDLSLAELLNVSDNIFLGREKTRKIIGLEILDKEFMKRESEKVLKRLGVKITSLDKEVRLLSGGQRQGVSISRAIYWDADVVIMDEPTAALGIHEKKQVKKLILDLKSKNVTVIIVSHEMSEVFELADRIIVLFQGKCVSVAEKEKTDVEEIAKLIITGNS